MGLRQDLELGFRLFNTIEVNIFYTDSFSVRLLSKMSPHPSDDPGAAAGPDKVSYLVSQHA